MSIVCRGLGRNAASAALLVTAGLGLSLFVDDVRPNTYGGGHARGDDLALQVARGERGSEGWWGYVAPKPVEEIPAVAPRQEPAAKPAAAPAPAEVLPARVALTPEQAQAFEALLPSARSPEEAALLLSLVLSAPQPDPIVTVRTGQANVTDDELALLALLMAAEKAR